MGLRLRPSLLLATILPMGAAAARAQSGAPADTVAEVHRLRDGGDFTAAAALIEPYASAHADVPGVAWLAAQTLYWAKRPTQARAFYEAALDRAPEDLELRVDFGRYLVETGDAQRARAVLRPAVDASPTRARALTLLGTRAYWDGDLTTAQRTLRDALRADSANAAARRQLREIAEATASWLGVGGTLARDDQPLRNAGGDVEAGWFATPLTPLSLQVQSTAFDIDARTESVSGATMALATYLPAARLDLALRGGLLSRSFGDRSDWTGRALVGVRFPHGVAVQGSAARAPYVSTRASLVLPVMTRTVEGALRWRSTRGWMVDVVSRHESYPDHNSIWTGYGWLLAPLVHRPGGDLHVGYSFAAQSATESRFAPRDLSVYPPGQLPPEVPGEYRPYYTPRNLRVSSALASASVHPNGRWSLTGSGSWGIHARDDAPVIVSVSPPPQLVRQFYARSFTPWTVRGGLDVHASDAVRIAVNAAHERTAYYEVTSVKLRVVYTFVAAARRHAEPR